MENAYLFSFLPPDRAEALLAKYFLDLEAKSQQLTTFLSENNMAGIRQTAHSLKGSGKSYGFDYVTELGTKLSAFAKEENHGALGNLIREFREWLRGHAPDLS